LFGSLSAWASCRSWIEKSSVSDCYRMTICITSFVSRPQTMINRVFDDLCCMSRLSYNTNSHIPKKTKYHLPNMFRAIVKLSIKSKTSSPENCLKLRGSFRLTTNTVWIYSPKMFALTYGSARIFKIKSVPKRTLCLFPAVSKHTMINTYFSSLLILWYIVCSLADTGTITLFNWWSFHQEMSTSSRLNTSSGRQPCRDSMIDQIISSRKQRGTSRWCVSWRIVLTLHNPSQWCLLNQFTQPQDIVNW
jgi:hypothetical protein